MDNFIIEIDSLVFIYWLLKSLVYLLITLIKITILYLRSIFLHNVHTVLQKNNVLSVILNYPYNWVNIFLRQPNKYALPFSKILHSTINSSSYQKH
jgi:hypothetical protein